VGGVVSAMPVAAAAIAETIGLIRSRPVRRNQIVEAIADRAAQEVANTRMIEVENVRRAKEQAASAARVEEEEATIAKAKQEDAGERAVKKAKDELGATDAARKEPERKSIEGIQPVVWRTTEDIRATKIRLRYRESIYHLAIAGVSGSGKSPLINVFRELRDSDHGAAPTGIVETTSMITRSMTPTVKTPLCGTIFRAQVP
jgi:ABC-type glutathione transport system ATPase component